jgi:hypothetical protein
MDWLNYANQGATRNQPIAPELAQALGFLPEMGITMDVFSGGQPAQGSGGARVGSVRHDDGGSADVFFNQNGRRLDWANPDDVPIYQDIVRRARANGVTGFGAGDGYMQPGSMHVGFGTPAVWGAGGRGANAPEWLRAAYDGAPAGQQPTISTRNAPDTPQAVGRDTRSALGLLQNEGNQMAQPQQPQRPQGLLGSLGVQRRDPNAQGETSQPFYNRQSFGDTLARLAPALGRMGVMGLEGPMQAQLDTRNQRQGDERAQAMQAEQKNATAEWLRSQGAGQLADGVMSGALTGAQAMSQMQAQAAAAASAPMNAIELETAQAELDQLRTPPPDLEGEAKLRGEFTSLPIVKSFSAQSTAYGRVLASVNDPTPAGDLALIFNFMKVLDPGSTVREGEFATAAQSGGVDDRVRALYNQVVEGTRLSDPQRDDFANRATRLYSNAEQQYKGIADQYSAFAVQSGFDPATMMPDFTYSGDRYQTPMALTPPQLTGAQLVQMGLSAQEWQDTWATFTDQERQEFLGAN